MTTNANLFEPERKKKAHSKTHHKDAEAILRVLKDLWKMKQRGDLRGASKLLTKHNVSRLPVDIYLGFIDGKSYEDLTLDYASEVKPLLNKAKKERYGKSEEQQPSAEQATTPIAEICTKMELLRDAFNTTMQLLISTAKELTNEQS